MRLTSADWIAILPAAFLVAGSLAAALAGAGRRRPGGGPDPGGLGWPLEACAFLGLGIPLGLVAGRLRGGASPAAGFGGAVVLDDLALLVSLVVLSAAGLAILLSVDFLDRRGVPKGEYVALVLLSAAGMVLLVQSRDLITLFMSVELLSLGLYALAGTLREERRSVEAAAKYFVPGALASAFLLYGLALLYGASGALSLGEIGRALRERPPGLFSPAALGMALAAVGFMFKVGAVPFHVWVPDVYEGAPTAVTAFMAAAVKASAFGALLRILLDLGPLPSGIAEIIAAVAAATMVGGNAAALRQDSVKRMLAYSSVAHAGYVLVAVASLPGAGPEAASAAVFYLAAYAFMTLGAFAFLEWMGREGREAEGVDSFDGLGRRRPWAAAAMTLFLLSLGGIPPTAGFFAKFWVFKAALEGGQVLLVVIGVLTTALSLYYYLRVVAALYLKPPPEGAREEVSASAGFAVAVAAAATLLLGLWPSGFLAAARMAISNQ